jgi:GTPase SAR1 family protein
MEDPNMNRSLNVYVIGGAQSGKSSWIRRIKSGTFDNNYSPTLETAVEEIDCKTDKGDIKVRMFDFGAKGRISDHYVDVDACILFFSTYEETKRFYFEFSSFSIAPVLLVISKIDIPNHHMVNYDKLKQFRDGFQLRYHGISSKSCHNFEKPLKFCLEQIDAKLHQEEPVVGKFMCLPSEELSIKEQIDAFYKCTTTDILRDLDLYIDKRGKEKEMIDQFVKDNNISDNPLYTTAVMNSEKHLADLDDKIDFLRLKLIILSLKK